MRRNQFTFYRSYYEALMKLPKSKRLAALEAVIVYALEGVEPQGLDSMQTMAFLLIQPTLDAGRAMAKGAVKARGKKKFSNGMPKEKENEGEEEKEIEIETEKKTETEDDSLTEAGFERFWDLYPVKLGKKNAREVWLRLKPDANAVCEGVARWMDAQQWRKENGRFIPRAAKFLEERYFEQVPPGYIPRGATGFLGTAELEAIEKIMREPETEERIPTALRASE